MRHRVGDHAVVLGASMAGLLAARVLSESYRRVTVIDRDAMPAIGEHRRGVPHGRHLHALHARGRQILDELFPGLTVELVEAGAESGDSLGNVRWHLSGHELRQTDIGLPGLCVSRPFLEGHVCARVRKLPAVALLERSDVVGLTTSADAVRATGVRVDPHGSQETLVPAELVVDATGRSSRTPLWLEELGYPVPRADRIEIGLGYATRNYQLRPGAMGTDLMILTAATPQNPRAGMLATTESGRHILTVAGMLGDYPPTDPTGFDAFVATLGFPDIAKALSGAEPLDDPVPFRFPASVRHRYERLARFPDGLLVIGDAICSFNPIYGQGMTVAAIQAIALRRLLAAGEAPAARRYFRQIARLVDVPWEIATGADLAFPGVPGSRTAKIRMVNAYLPRLHAAARTDTTLGRAFIRVMGMVDRPEGLLRPDRALRVLWGNARRPAVPAASRAIRQVRPGGAHDHSPPGVPPRGLR